MNSEPNAMTWEALSAEILSGMREWRLQHPKATLREIEEAVDAHWYRLRVRLVHDLALQRVAANWKDTPPSERPVCPTCGTLIVLRGTRPRKMKTHGGQTLTLQRRYGHCPTCNQGLRPTGTRPR